MEANPSPKMTFFVPPKMLVGIAMNFAVSYVLRWVSAKAFFILSGIGKRKLTSGSGRMVWNGPEALKILPVHQVQLGASVIFKLLKTDALCLLLPFGCLADLTIRVNI